MYIFDGKKCKEYREAFGLTRAELAAKLQANGATAGLPSTGIVRAWEEEFSQPKTCVQIGICKIFSTPERMFLVEDLTRESTQESKT